MNFDNRLLLPLAFYDTVDKQAFRQDKCGRNLKTWQLMADPYRLPPFEFVITECTGTACSGAVYELYDTQDNLIADLGVDYDIHAFITQYSSNGRTWTQYEGDDPFDTILPFGQYYIKVDCGSCQLYSEVITICACDPRYSDPDVDPSSGDNMITSLTNSGTLPYEHFVGGPNGWEFGRCDHTAGSAFAYSNTFTVVNGMKYLVKFYMADYIAGDTADLSMAFYDLDGNLASNVFNFPTGVNDGDTISEDLIATKTGLVQLRFMYTKVGASLWLNNNGADYNKILLYRYDGANIVSYCEDSLQLNYSNTNDLVDASIYYKGGYENRIIFQPKTDLTKPEYETVKVATPRSGRLFVSQVTNKKKHRIVFYAPEYMADAMSILAEHDTITLIDKNGDTGSVTEVDVQIDPVYHCFFKIEISFYLEPFNNSNCGVDL